MFVTSVEEAKRLAYAAHFVTPSRERVVAYLAAADACQEAGHAPELEAYLRHQSTVARADALAEVRQYDEAYQKAIYQERVEAYRQTGLLPEA